MGLSMNRKAESSFDIAKKSIYWMISGVVITMIVMVFAMFLGNTTSQYTYNPPQLEVDFITLSFVNTAECFAYVDESDVLHPYSIDLRKFKQEKLRQECYPLPNDQGREHYNFALSLEKDPENNKFVTAKYFNINDYSKTIYVKVYDETGFKRTDNLKIAVQYEKLK
jgi:hypothetical protein